MSVSIDKSEFTQVVDFHGCYCLDIALGYRVAKALVREMGEHLNDMKKVYAYVGTNTCAVDAIQKITGCTAGKRNLIYADLGKSVFVLQNTVSGKTLRAYCHFWDQYDHTEMRAKRKAAADDAADEQAKRQFKTYIDAEINRILTLEESQLFRITATQLPIPEKSSKYLSEPCARCGEFTKAELLRKQDEGKICPECSA